MASPNSYIQSLMESNASERVKFKLNHQSLIVNEMLYHESLKKSEKSNNLSPMLSI